MIQKTGEKTDKEIKDTYQTNQFRLHLSQEQVRLELFLRGCDVPGSTSSTSDAERILNDVPHQNGKRDQVRKHFRKLCQEIPQKPIRWMLPSSTQPET